MLAVISGCGRIGTVLAVALADAGFADAFGQSGLGGVVGNAPGDVMDGAGAALDVGFTGFSRHSPVLTLLRGGLLRLGRDGWRAGLAMGAFLTAGYVLQTFGLESTSASAATASPAARSC